VSLSIYLWAYL